MQEHGPTEPLRQWIIDRMTEGGVTGRAQEEWKSLCVLACCYIWKARCKAMFEGKRPNLMERVLPIKGAHVEMLRVKPIGGTKIRKR